MWFNNIQVYRYTRDKSSDLDALLALDRLKPCPPHARFIYGWTSVFADNFVHTINQCSFLCMGKEERILPRGVIQHLLKERIQTRESQQGRTMKRTEKSQLIEELEFELLPKSFCLQKYFKVLMDDASHQLIVNAQSRQQAAQVTALLQKSLPDLQIESIQPQENIQQRFAEWINNPSSLPASFQLASDCVLFSPDDEKKRFHCKGCELPADEILALLAQGLIVAELSLLWNERIRFTITEDLAIKKLKCIDILTEEFQETTQLEDEYQQQDAAMILLSGELRALTHDLFHELARTST